MAVHFFKSGKKESHWPTWVSCSSVDQSALARFWGHKSTAQSVEDTDICLGVELAGQGNGKMSTSFHHFIAFLSGILIISVLI